MNFQTFGPFSIPMDIELKSADLERQFKLQNSGLNDASGVYIFIDAKTGFPVYVGKAARNSFGARIASHLNGAKNNRFRDWLDDPKVRPSLLLIALSAHDGALRRADRNKPPQHYWIGELEKLLIGACLSVNANLFNAKSVKLYRVLHVPGYLNSSTRDKKDFPAAEYLEKLLQKKARS